MKIIIFSFITLFLAGCSSIGNAWNVPYVDTNETLQLKYGMDKSKVLQILGYPLFVHSGWPIENEELTITWIYEVRSEEVQSKVAIDGSVTVQKTTELHRPNGVVHRLELIFINNQLVNWGPAQDLDDIVEEIAGDGASVGDVETPIYEKSWKDNIKDILGVITFGLSDMLFK